MKAKHLKPQCGTFHPMNKIKYSVYYIVDVCIDERFSKKHASLLETVLEMGQHWRVSMEILLLRSDKR